MWLRFSRDRVLFLRRIIQPHFCIGAKSRTTASPGTSKREDLSSEIGCNKEPDTIKHKIIDHIADFPVKSETPAAIDR